MKPVVGEQFGLLTITTEPVIVSKYGRRLWECGALCSCGRTTRVLVDKLAAGKRSCGCERGRVARERRLKHGHAAGTKTPEYLAWTHIIARCENPKSDHFKDYGGRGIRICERWRGSFEVFLADVGPRPSPEHSIDRFDNDGHYEPGNVRWATDEEQRSNKQSTIRIVYSGRDQTAAQWADELGIERWRLYALISRGTDPTQALERLAS